MAKTKLTISIDEELLKELKEFQEATGITVSSQIDMRLKGFSIVRTSNLKRMKRKLLKKK